MKTKLDQLHKRMTGPLSGWLEDDAPNDNELEQIETTEGISNGPERHGAGQRWRGRWRSAVKILRRLFVAGYPWASAVYEGLFFVYQLLYLYDHTAYYTPFLHLQGLQVKRLSLEDSVRSFSLGGRYVPAALTHNCAKSRSK